MIAIKKLLTLCFLLFSVSCLHAQIEGSHLRSKGFNAYGFGSFLNFGIPVSEGNSITAEAGFYYFHYDGDYVALVPFLLGYRHTFDGSGTGLYIEPTAGYSIGVSDIQKYNEYDTPIPDGNGDWLVQKAKGPAAGISTGYIFPGKLAFNIGLRYQHIFVSKDPGLNMFSLRLSHPLSFGRRDE
jgi:hypothetical protein